MTGEIQKCAPNTCCAIGITAEEKAATLENMSKVTCTQELSYEVSCGDFGNCDKKSTVAGEGSTELQARQNLESDYVRFKATFWCRLTFMSFGLFACDPDIQRGQIKCK